MRLAEVALPGPQAARAELLHRQAPSDETDAGRRFSGERGHGAEDSRRERGRGVALRWAP